MKYKKGQQDILLLLIIIIIICSLICVIIKDDASYFQHEFLHLGNDGLNIEVSGPKSLFILIEHLSLSVELGTNTRKTCA